MIHLRTPQHNIVNLLTQKSIVCYNNNSVYCRIKSSRIPSQTSNKVNKLEIAIRRAFDYFPALSKFLILVNVYNCVTTNIQHHDCSRDSTTVGTIVNSPSVNEEGSSPTS